MLIPHPAEVVSTYSIKITSNFLYKAEELRFYWEEIGFLHNLRYVCGIILYLLCCGSETLAFFTNLLCLTGQPCRGFFCIKP